MIARATDGTHSIDAIIVYSFSRAFRNQLEQELTVRELRKHRVELISHAEPLTKDDTGDLFRKFIGIVNEFQSKETSRATTRTMKENARRGYSNGGNIPFGYKSIDAEVIGNKQKKRLEIRTGRGGNRSSDFQVSHNQRRRKRAHGHQTHCHLAERTRRSNPKRHIVRDGHSPRNPDQGRLYRCPPFQGIRP